MIVPYVWAQLLMMMFSCAGIILLKFPMGYSRQLRFQRVLIGLFILSLMIGFASLMLPSEVQLLHSMAPWEDPLPHLEQALPARVMLQEILPEGPTLPQFPIFDMALTTFILASMAFVLLRLVKETRYLKKLAVHAHILYRYKNILVMTDSFHTVGLSFSLGRNRYVLLPLQVTAQTWWMTLAHELQHHRQRDPLWAWGMQILRFFFIWNPCFRKWDKSLCELQELACDEALMQQQKVSGSQYARCLLEAAQLSLRFQPAPPVGTTGVAVGMHGTPLQRRIRMLLNFHTVPSKPWMHFLFVALMLVLGSASFASSSLMNQTLGKELTMAEAQALLKDVSKETDFPLVMNEEVLRELNFYIGDHKGRKFSQESLKRLEAYRSMFEQKIQAFNHPLELMAIPFIESGVRNLPQSQTKPAHGAGLWMFIRSTAKKFNLKVKLPHVDERLNEEKETVAAMEYLKLNKEEFKSWPHAIVAYNMGERGLRRALDKVPEQDLWEAQRQYSPEPRYLAKFMAANLILKRPHLVGH